MVHTCALGTQEAETGELLRVGTSLDYIMRYCLKNRRTRRTALTASVSPSKREARDSDDVGKWATASQVL